MSGIDRTARVAIVGGGLAGLAAAVGLAGRGLAIDLYESRPRLGGRASSFPDPTTGELVDNCQHVGMACCTNLVDFCDRVGASGLFRRVGSITFLSPEGRVSALAAGPWPAPLHLAGSFLGANYLTWPQRLRVAYGLVRLRSARGDRPGEPFVAWLRRHGQDEGTIDRYWATVLVSALNERLDRMDVGHARKVFLDGFLRHRDGYRMDVPTAPLGRIYGEGLEAWLRDRGVTLRLKSGVREVEAGPDGRVAGLALRDGTTVAADAVVLAAPFDRVGGLVPDGLMRRIPKLDRAAALPSSPITGVHLWFDRPVCPFDHVVTVGRPIHWVFRHPGGPVRAVDGGTVVAAEYLQVVISASYDLLGLDNRSVLDLVRRELDSIWPLGRAASLLHWRVVTEHGATFAVRPGVDADRPPQRTPVPGLFLAGDWTATGWPATMEGAVRSGYLAAEGVLADLGRPERLVRASLPAGRLARWLLGPGPDAAEAGPVRVRGAS